MKILAKHLTTDHIGWTNPAGEALISYEVNQYYISLVYGNIKNGLDTYTFSLGFNDYVFLERPVQNYNIELTQDELEDIICAVNTDRQNEDKVKDYRNRLWDIEKKLLDKLDA